MSPFQIWRLSFCAHHSTLSFWIVTLHLWLVWITLYLLGFVGFGFCVTSLNIHNRRTCLHLQKMMPLYHISHVFQSNFCTSACQAQGAVRRPVLSLICDCYIQVWWMVTNTERRQRPWLKCAFMLKHSRIGRWGHFAIMQWCSAPLGFSFWPVANGFMLWRAINVLKGLLLFLKLC